MTVGLSLQCSCVIYMYKVFVGRNQPLRIAYYFLFCNKKSRFDFADELKVGDVRYDNMT